MGDRELTHLSLFSGIGGLDLAAEWAGIRTVGQCEWAEYPTKVLERHWPEVPRWRDIRTLTEESFYERTGRRTVDVISGGFPCQPFSVAGKQRGKEDDRYLWPEMVRVVKELRPAWVVGENVAGIIRMALPDILSELEGCGYRTRAFLVPACAVGARHRRYRVAIVGCRTDCLEDSSGSGCGRPGDVREQQGGAEPERSGEYMADTLRNSCKFSEPPENEAGIHESANGGEDVRHSAGEGLSDRAGGQMGGQGTQEPEPERPDSHASDADNGSRNVRRNGKFSAVEETGRERCDFGNGEKEHEPGERRSTEPELGGMADGISDWMDGDLDFILNHYWDTEPDVPRIAEGIKHRGDRLKALGNAVVPQQFYPVFKAIAEIERGVGEAQWSGRSSGRPCAGSRHTRST